MKIAIIYGTRHGCTDKCAHTLANEIETNTTLINIDVIADTNLSEFDTIIIGGSVHLGIFNKKIKKFIDKNLDQLLNKKLGLFLCCLFDGDSALNQFQNAFPEKLRNKAIAHGLFGGELDFNKISFIEKAIVKTVANLENSFSNINYISIKDFAKEMLN